MEWRTIFLLVQQFPSSGVARLGRRKPSVSIFNEIDVEDEMKLSSSVTFSLAAAHSEEMRNWLRSCARDSLKPFPCRRRQLSCSGLIGVSSNQGPPTIRLGSTLKIVILRAVIRVDQTRSSQLLCIPWHLHKVQSLRGLLLCYVPAPRKARIVLWHF